jgi:signal transduction histidine kinase
LTCERRELEERLSDFEQHEEQERELRLLADRERIGHDLHDLVIQQLFATGMSLQGAMRSADDASRERLESAVDEIDGTIRQIRNVIFATESRRAGGLRDTALELIRDSRRILGFEAKISFSGPVDALVPGYVADQMLATLREAISNIARHARANRVDVAVTAYTDVVLTVSDDGVGFDPGIRSEGKGLGNMRARAEKLGGTLTLRKGQGGGTTIEWRVPAPKSDDLALEPHS